MNKTTTANSNTFNDDISDSNVFDDIDLFNFKGIKKINKPTNYPFIKIETQDKQTKRVVYKISSKDSIAFIYKLENKYWTTVRESRTDTGHMLIYEYIEPGRIIELDYLADFSKTNYLLHSAYLIEPNKEIGYSYFSDKGIDIKPNIDNFKIVEKNAKSTYLTEFEQQKDGKLRVVKNYFKIKENRIFYSDTSFYDTKNHSQFWWRYFGLNTIIK